MNAFWNGIDKIWRSLASVKITLFVFVSLLLLSFPGMVLLQHNISNVDPGIQYDFEFWQFGEFFQLFSAYHSFWYVGLIGLLAVNLIACSEQRWPQMWQMATAKAVALKEEGVAQRPDAWKYEWSTKKSLSKTQSEMIAAIRSPWCRPKVIQEDSSSFQIFWQTGRWSRLANYLVHTSLLFVFIGAIYSALYGFEGAMNIPEGQAVDTFLIFKEGKLAGLKPVPGGLKNERDLGFRVKARRFDVEFYKDFPGRPKNFVSELDFINRRGIVEDRAEAIVNEPVVFRNFYFYQASYGRLGDYKVDVRLVDKKNPKDFQDRFTFNLGSVKQYDRHGVELVALRAMEDVQGLGAGVLFQEVENDEAVGKPFWALEKYPEFDFLNRKEAPYTVVVDSIKEQFFTGLQVGYDPGAPIYWFGCFGIILGTFYALLVQHRRYHLIFKNGKIILTGSTHRLPMGFEKRLKVWALELAQLSGGKLK